MKRTIINLYLINIFFALFEIKGISASDTCEEWSEWSACTNGISTRKCLSDPSILNETLICTKCDKWGVWSECKNGKKHRKAINCPFIKVEQECDVDNDMEDGTSKNNNYIYFNIDEEENENENEDEDENEDENENISNNNVDNNNVDNNNVDNNNVDNNNVDNNNVDNNNVDNNNVDNNNVDNNNVDNNNVDVDENYNDDEEEEEDVKSNDLNNSSSNNNNEITNFIQVNDKMTTKHKTTNIHPVNFIQQKYTKSNRHRSDDFSKILNSMNNMNNNNHTHRSSSSNNTKNFNTYRGNSYMHPHFSNYMSSSVSNTAREEKKTVDDENKIEHDNITKEERIVPINTQNNNNNNHHHHHHHHHGRSDIHEHDTSHSVDGDKYHSNNELPSLSTYDYDMNNDSYKNNYMKKLRDTVKEEQTKLNNNQNNEKLSSSEKHNDDISALYEHMNAKDQDHKQQEQSDSSSNSHFDNYSKLYIASGIGTLILLGGSIATYFLYKEKNEKVVQEETKEENFEVMFNDDAVKGKDNKAMDEEEFWALE
ncbi:merozoite TRAP-like protein [Plasmodium sp. DRC-Itaito]|nr:merozoite TRAP-like protein [Plasmodium sp. DRC-Itaito]